MIGLLVTLVATTTASAIEAFTSGVLLGTTLYTASKTNKVIRHRKR